MGSSWSSGCNNEELTDNLCEADYIRTPKVEKVFRAVDRGEYILPDYRMNAYRDQAWKNNHLHLSAPCIYSEVLEGLAIGPGMSFLNLGSGTGYLSTLVGLLLGHNGINHGVEYHEDVIQYANKKLDDFKRYSGAMDEFDFCEPKFMQGNCLCLTSERRYDRIYVGATCPVPFDHYLKSFLKIGGILIMPFHDQLIQVRRTSESAWNARPLLPVSFATLILPGENCKDTIELMDIEPESLQFLCRTSIRNLLRQNVISENPELCRPVERQKKNIRKTRPCAQHVCHDMNEFIIVPRSFDIPERSRSEMLLNLERDSDDGHEDPKAKDDDESEQSSSTVVQDEAQSTSIAGLRTVDTDDVEMACPPVQIQLSSNNRPTVSFDTASKTEHQRRKFDSGLGDEESNDDESVDEADGQELIKRTKFKLLKLMNSKSEETTDTSTDSYDAGCKDDISGTISPEPEQDNAESYSSSDNEEDDDEEQMDAEDMEFYHKRRTVDSPFTEHMCKKINELPLPPTLKSFLNYYRF